ELLARPSVLFADEPTSGLDPALERSLTQTFKGLTDDGSTVIVTTHVMSSLELLDKVCLLHGGHLAYFGPVEQIKNYFEVDDYTDIYRKLEEHDPKDWRAKLDHTDVGIGSW
ncbi:MAG: AAA family ATPase, partial [Bradymonadaceae bacterium]